MEENKRALRRWKSKCKFEKRIKIWAPANQMHYFEHDKIVTALMREKIREGECWTFLRTTSRPCNCWMCSTYEKYVRTPKQEIDKKIWDDIQDDLAS